MLSIKKLNRIRNLLVVLFVASFAALALSSGIIMMVVSAVLGIGAIYLAALSDDRVENIIEENKRCIQVCLARLRFSGGPPDHRDVKIIPDNMIEIDVY